MIEAALRVRVETLRLELDDPFGREERVLFPLMFALPSGRESRTLPRRVMGLPSDERSL